jgi:hypothetical protein
MQGPTRTLEAPVMALEHSLLQSYMPQSRMATTTPSKQHCCPVVTALVQLLPSCRSGNLADKSPSAVVCSAMPAGQLLPFTRADSPLLALFLLLQVATQCLIPSHI